MKNNISSETERTIFSCAVCNAEWITKKKTGLPCRCPRCKSKLWNQCFKHHCIKCGYEWNSANESPDRCPQCQTKKWTDVSPSLANAPLRFDEMMKPILLRYDAGMGCVKISSDLNITFSEVYEVIRNTYPEAPVRL